MCKTGTFLWGLAAGMVAGAMLEIIILPRPRPRRTGRGQGHAAHGQRHGPGAGVGGRKDELKNGGCGPMSAG